MKKIYLLFLSILISTASFSQLDSLNPKDQTEINKEIARDFYEDLWFSDNTEKYHEYLADEYVVHDIGDRKNVTEAAVEQKNIADFFWKHLGERDNEIDFQIAEGDLVATRWTIKSSQPKTLFGRVLLDNGKPLSIINVFRFQEGKIVEIWNHRHDIETSQTMKFTFQGLGIGLLIALIPTIIAIRYRRKLKRLG